MAFFPRNTGKLVYLDPYGLQSQRAFYSITIHQKAVLWEHWATSSRFENRFACYLVFIMRTRGHMMAHHTHGKLKRHWKLNVLFWWLVILTANSNQNQKSCRILMANHSHSKLKTKLRRKNMNRIRKAHCPELTAKLQNSLELSLILIWIWTTRPRSFAFRLG